MKLMSHRVPISVKVLYKLYYSHVYKVLYKYTNDVVLSKVSQFTSKSMYFTYFVDTHLYS